MANVFFSKKNAETCDPTCDSLKKSPLFLCTGTGLWIKPILFRLSLYHICPPDSSLYRLRLYMEILTCRSERPAFSRSSALLEKRQNSRAVGKSVQGLLKLVSCIHNRFFKALEPAGVAIALVFSRNLSQWVYKSLGAPFTGFAPCSPVHGDFDLPVGATGIFSPLRAARKPPKLPRGWENIIDFAQCSPIHGDFDLPAGAADIFSKLSAS